MPGVGRRLREAQIQVSVTGLHPRRLSAMVVAAHHTDQQTLVGAQPRARREASLALRAATSPRVHGAVRTIVVRTGHAAAGTLLNRLEAAPETAIDVATVTLFDRMVHAAAATVPVAQSKPAPETEAESDLHADFPMALTRRPDRSTLDSRDRRQHWASRQLLVAVRARVVRVSLRPAGRARRHRRLSDPAGAATAFTTMLPSIVAVVVGGLPSAEMRRSLGTAMIGMVVGIRALRRAQVV